MTISIHISTSVPTLTTTGVRRGVDVSVTIAAGGRSWDGEVTLIRDPAATAWVWTSWGSRDNWCSGEVLQAADEIECDDISSSEVLDLVLAEATEAIELDTSIEAAVEAAEAERVEAEAI